MADEFSRDGQDSQKQFDASPPADATDSLRQDAYRRTANDSPPPPPPPGAEAPPAIPAPGSGAPPEVTARQGTPSDAPPTARPGSDYGAGRNSVMSDNFDNPISHLERAQQAMRRRDMRGAEAEYFQAIRAADNIDQREVAREREAIKRQLEAERDPARRRQLVQWDSTLGDMQRAPGFTRANLAFAYMSQGYQSEGTLLLMEAGRLDPQMARDPNFVRHLRRFDRARAGEPGQVAPGGGFEPGQGRPGRYDEPGAPGGRPADRPPTQGADRPPTQGADRPPTQGADRPPTQGADRPPTQGADRPPTQGADRPAPVVERPSGNVRPDQAGFDNPFAHIQTANQEFLKTNTMTPQAKAEYEAGIKAADNMDRQWLAQQYKALDESYKKAFPAETQQRVAALEKERDALLEALPADKKAQLAELGKKAEAATTEAEKKAAMDQMRALAPEAAAKQDSIDQLAQQAKAIEEQMVILENMDKSSALSRFAYAEALRRSGDKEGAKKYLQEVALLDPASAQQEVFKKAASDVGLTIAPPTAADRPANAGDAPAPAGDKPAEAPAQAGGDKDSLQLLAEADEKLKKDGFAAAKPIFERAIAAADAERAGNVGDVDGKLKVIEEQLKDQTLSADKKKELEDMGKALVLYKHAPFIARFQYGVAQNNAGDQAGAKATFDQAAAKDAEFAQDPGFKKAQELAAKPGEKITEESLKAAGGQAAGSFDNPHAHMLKATELRDKGDMKSAETEYKASIAAADKLPFDTYRARVAELDKAIATASDPVQSQTLLQEKQTLQALIDYPVNSRLEAAVFYLKNSKPDEAKQLLDQAVAKDPKLKEDEAFRRMSETSANFSKGTLEKMLDFAKDTGKTVLIDGGSGTAGLAIMSLFPQRRLLGLAAGLAGAGGTHYALSNALGKETTLARSMVWGGVDLAAFASAGAVRNKLMTGFEANVAKGSFSKLGVAAADMAAIDARVMAGKMTQLERLTAITELATKESALKKEAMSSVLSATVKDMPWYKRWGVQTQAHIPGLRGIGTTLEPYRVARAEMTALTGTRWSYLNPLTGFKPLGEASNLKAMEASNFWKRWTIDAAMTGTASGIYRGAHNASEIGSVNPNTGQTYTAYDAISNTVTGTAGDAITGGFLVGTFRGFGGYFTRHGGPVAEVAPLTRPVLSAEAGVLGKGAHYVWRMPKYGFDKYISTPIGNGATKVGNYMGGDGRIPGMISTVPAGAAIWSPKLYEGFGAWEKISAYEKVLADIQKPLEDKSATTASKPADVPAPAVKPADKPAETKPAETKPAEAQPAPAPKPPTDGGVDQGLPE